MKLITKVYLIAALLSLILFLSGIWLGFFLSKTTLLPIEKEISSLENQLETIREEYFLLGIKGKEGCMLLRTLSQDLAQKLNNISSQFKILEERGEHGQLFEDLKKEYVLLSLKAWILNSNIREYCNQSIVASLYFYSFPCNECGAQEIILEKLKNKYYGDFLVYGIDCSVDSPVVEALKKSYGVKKVPSLLIGGELIEGYRNFTYLDKLIANNLNVSSSL